MMKLILFLKSFIFEALIILLLIFIYNNFLDNAIKTINADGIGYYDYLPSIFIHSDMDRRDMDKKANPEFFNRIETLGVYIDFKEKYKLNKYPCGTALLESPFFLFTLLTTKKEGQILTGYEKPFQRTIFHAAIFFLFLSLIFLKRTLMLYRIKPVYIFLTQLLLVLGTSVTHYVNEDAGFSHVYSLFAITTFIYFVKSYYVNYKTRDFMLSCILLGLIFLLRNVNIIIILFIPFLAGSFENLMDGISRIFKNKSILIYGILALTAILSIQCILWFLQTRNFIVYSYSNESFDFFHPAIIDILFSYRKGLFIYAPVIFISCFGLIQFIIKKQYYLFFSWFFFFSILTYLLSSWWSWYYGCSFGLRAYIDFYTVFFILFALMINSANLKLKILLCFISLLAIPLNLIQTYQYKEFILHWDKMDKEKYWKVFLKCDKNYKDIIWKKKYDYNHYKTVFETSLPNLNIIPNSGRTTLFKISSNNIPDFASVSMVHVSFENDFREDNFSKIELSILDTSGGNVDFYQDPFLVHFADHKLNQLQTGFYDYEFKPFTDKQERNIFLNIFSKEDSHEINLYNTKITFLKPI